MARPLCSYIVSSLPIAEPAKERSFHPALSLLAVEEQRSSSKRNQEHLERFRNVAYRCFMATNQSGFGR